MEGCEAFRAATGTTGPLLMNAWQVAGAYNIDRAYVVVDGDGIVRWKGPRHYLPVAEIQDTIATYLAILADPPQSLVSWVADDSLRLSWTPAPNVTGYGLYRSINPLFIGEQLLGVPIDTFYVLPIPSDSLGFFRVRARR